VNIAAIYLFFALWGLCNLLAWQTVERYETEIVLLLRLHHGRARTTEDWHYIKNLLVLFGPVTLVAVTLWRWQ
jgi:hypothetical protein